MTVLFYFTITDIFSGRYHLKLLLLLLWRWFRINVKKKNVYFNLSWYFRLKKTKIEYISYLFKFPICLWFMKMLIVTKGSSFPMFLWCNPALYFIVNDMLGTNPTKVTIFFILHPKMFVIERNRLPDKFLYFKFSKKKNRKILTKTVDEHFWRSRKKNVVTAEGRGGGDMPPYQ